MKLLLLISCAVACVALSFAWREPWIGGVGLLVAFVAMLAGVPERLRLRHWPARILRGCGLLAALALLTARDRKSVV